jgi:hypothetical protein
LRERAEEIRSAGFVFLHPNWKLELQILRSGSLRLNSFVIVAVTFLDSDIDTGRRLPDDDAKSNFPFHEQRISLLWAATWCDSVQ